MLSDKEFKKLNQEAFYHATREHEEIQFDKSYTQEEAKELGAFDDETSPDIVNNYEEKKKIDEFMYNNDITTYASPGPLTWQGKLLYSPLMIFNWLRNFGK